MMLSPFVAQTIVAMEEGHEKINHWIVGGIALFILLALLGALLAFGGGREHS